MRSRSSLRPACCPRAGGSSDHGPAA